MKPPANIQRLKKTLNLGKIIRIAICVTDSYGKVKNIVHHACLENILKKLIVVNGPTCLDLKNPSSTGSMGVSVKTLQYLTFAPKKDGDDYFVFDGLPFLDPKSKFFKTWTESSHNNVAMLAHRCARIDSVGHFFKKCHDRESEFRRR